MTVSVFVLAAGAAVCSAACLLLLLGRRIARLSNAFVRLPALQKTVLVLGVTVATVSAQKGVLDATGSASFAKGWADTGAFAGTEGIAPAAGRDVGVADAVRGYKLESVSTNANCAYAMPEGAAVVGTWHLTGAYEDVARVCLCASEEPDDHSGGSAFFFPLGRHFCNALWAFTWGKVRPQLRNASNEIAAVGAPMSALPGVSRLWTVATTNGSRLLTWENFVAGRRLRSETNASTIISAQLELFPSGDFIARSNEVVYAYRRVNPYDWDDDGIPNEEDDDPYRRANGDSGFGPHQEVPDGDDPDHYYWVDMVVRQANARVSFAGDGASWLPDPVFIAKAGEICRVHLLVGKTYRVWCDQPVEVVGRSDDEVDVWEEDGVTAVCWPVWFERVAVPLPSTVSADGAKASAIGTGTTIKVHPQRVVGGRYDLTDEYCCWCMAADGTPVFDCLGDCGCGGCQTGDIVYKYSGYELVFGGWCCGCGSSGDDECSGEENPDAPPDGPAVSAAFSSKAIVFEESYTNAPGQVVGWRSSDLEVTCSAYGGTNGIFYSFTIEGAEDKLVRVAGARFPLTGVLEAGKSLSRRIKYKAVAPSVSMNDIVVRAECAESGTGRREIVIDKATAVKVYVDAKSEFPANRRRHLFGPNERYQILTEPGGYGTGVKRSSLSQGAYSEIINVEDADYVVELAVVHPSSDVRGNFVRKATPADWEEVGMTPLADGVVGAGFVANWYLQPDYVSFGDVLVCEGNADMIDVWGCFTNTTCYPPELYSHNPGTGACNPVSVGYGNRIGNEDFIGVQLGVPPASDGGYSVMIPLFWGVEDAACTNDFAAKRQSVSVTADGMTTIGKGDLYTVRKVNE
ncbi:MAG: hypothetical protein ACI4RD_04435 [Kiritimatiellia bacterium]